MPRPPLPLGTYGKIRIYQIGPKKWRAIANYKDYDGITRPVERVGASQTGAANNLRDALRDRSRKSADGEIKPETKVAVAADMWLQQIDRSDKAIRTKQEYRDTWNRYLVTTIGQLRVRDVRVSTVNRVITAVRDNHGRGAAIHVKVVLTGIFALVVRHDAMDDNPVREIESLGPRKRKKQRMVNTKTINAVRGVFHSSNDAVEWDLVDMVDVLSGLGCRLGELFALDWDTSIDFDNQLVTFRSTVVRVTKVGLIVQPHTKSEAGMRTIPPPAWVFDILKRRYETRTSDWVFPNTIGKLRDPDNTRKYFRLVVKRTEFEGLHPHDFRHYVADVLDKAGLSARQIADYLGHERIATTQEDYMERGVVGQEAAAAMANEPRPEKPKDEG